MTSGSGQEAPPARGGKWRPLRLWLTSSLVVIGGFAIIAGNTEQAQAESIQPFRFARVTDTHIGNGETNVKADEEGVAAVNALSPLPDLVINTGDLVDEGTASQYLTYLSVFARLPMPRYDMPGNHDVRWAPLGKESIQDAVHIPLYRSFDHKGCHFVLLDSTVTLEHWGHFDAGEMDWLRHDLARVGRRTPIFIFFHHWVGRDGVMVDNEDEFLRVIAPYNVPIVYCGHGHADIQWRVNGVQYIMDRGLYQGSFDFTDVTPTTIRLYRYRKEDPAPHLIAAAQTYPGRPDRETIRMEARVEGSTLTAWSSGVTIPPEARWQWRADFTGPWAAMAAQGSSARASIIPAALGHGLHTLTVRLVLPLPPDRQLENHDQGGFGGDAWETSIPLSPLEPAPGASSGFREVWRTKLGGGIQSKLALSGGLLYVSCTDGALYALDPENGRQRWIFRTKGSLYGTPCVNEGRVYIASMDHHVYALDAQTGRLDWEAPLGGPAFAGVRIGDGVACVGAGDSVVYGFDALTGAPRWTFKAGGFIQQQAAFLDHAFFVGAWDNGFYAIEAPTGQLRWRKHFGRSFFYSPSIGAPAVSGGRVFVPSNDDTLHAVDARTGAVDWEVHAPDNAGSYGYSGPFIASEGRMDMAALGDRGSVMAVDPTTGATLWQADTGSVIYDSSCAEAGGVVTVGSVDGKFHAINAATGKLLDTYRIGTGHLLASPAMTADGRRAFIGSLGNEVVALDTPQP